MRTILALMLVLSVSSMLVPGLHAGETLSASYHGALGYRHPVTDLPPSHAAVLICAARCDFNDPCEDVPGSGELCVPTNGAVPVIGPMSGAEIRATGTWASVIVTPEDIVHGSEAGIMVCFGEDDCGPGADYPTAPGCGAAAAIGRGFGADSVLVLVYTVIVEDDLGVCGGTAGMVEARFF